MTLRDVKKSISDTLYRQVGRASSQVQQNQSLPVDVLENEDTYLVVFDTPGVESDDVQVRYLDGEIRIRIDRFREFYDGFEMRYPGRGMSLDGDTELPDDAIVDPNAATARLTETGTLHIDIPKTEATDEKESTTDTDSEPEELTTTD